MKMQWMPCKEAKDGSVRFLGPIDGSLLHCRSGFSGKRSVRFEKGGGGLTGKRNHDIGYRGYFQSIQSTVTLSAATVGRRR